MVHKVVSPGCFGCVGAGVVVDVVVVVAVVVVVVVVVVVGGGSVARFSKSSSCCCALRCFSMVEKPVWLVNKHCPLQANR